MVATPLQTSVYDVRVLAKTIASFLKNKRDGLSLTVAQLTEILPNLTNVLDCLPPETVFVRFTQIKDNLAEVTLKIYRSPEGEVALYDAGETSQKIALNSPRWLNYQILSGRSGYYGTQTLAVGGKTLKIPLGLAKDWNQAKEGSGLVPLAALKTAPMGLTPMAQLEVNQTFEVIELIAMYEGESGSSPIYSMQPLNGGEPSGNPLNLIANASLKQLVADLGLPCRVILLNQEPLEDGSGVRCEFGMSLF